MKKDLTDKKCVFQCALALVKGYLHSNSSVLSSFFSSIKGMSKQTWQSVESACSVLIALAA